MKLSDEQIQQVEKYLAKFEIKYFEVYAEVLDHIILSVEEILSNEVISLQEAIIKAKEQDFGKFGFKSMIQHRTDELNKNCRNHYNAMIKSYFKMPEIVMTLLVFISFYSVISLFQKPVKVASALLISLSVLVLIDWIRQRKLFKINNKKVLKMESLSYYSNGVFLWMYFSNFLVGLGKEKFEKYELAFKITFSVLFTMCFLSFLIFMQIRKKVVGETKQLQFMQ